MTSKLNREDSLNKLNAISDEERFNSDDGGDSNAEDEHILSIPTITHQIEHS